MMTQPLFSSVTIISFVKLTQPETSVYRMIELQQSGGNDERVSRVVFVLRRTIEKRRKVFYGA